MIVGTLFRMLFIFVSVAIFIVVAGVVALPYVVPAEKYKALAIEEAKKATGRDLTIGGDVKFAVWPNLSLEVNDVTFSNASWASEKEMIKLSSMSIGLKLFPLLTGKIDIGNFILVNPVIALEKNKDGAANWEFAKTEEKKDTETESSSITPITGFSLSNLRIINGTLSYTDASTNSKQKLSELNVDLELAGLDKPGNVKGSTVMNGQKINVDATIDSPMKLQNKEEAKVFAKIDASGAKIDFSGNLRQLNDDMTAEGVLKLHIASLRTLSEASGSKTSIPEGAPDSVTLDSNVSWKNKTLGLSEMNIKVDAIEASGELSADLTNASPAIKANLSIPSLDLTPFMAKSEDAAAAAPEESASTSNGWSNQTLAFAGLTKFEADIKAKIVRLILPQTIIENTEVALKSHAGKLTVDLKETNLYGGKGKAYLVLDSRGEIPSLAQQFSLTNINVGNFLKDFYHNENVDGTGNIALDVSTLGKSQLELVSNATGRGSISFRNGKIRGVNVLDMLKQATTASATLGNLLGQNKETEVTELSATFDIKQGVIYNNDLALMTPVGLVSGEGEVNLPKRLLRYRLTPKLDLKPQTAAAPADPNAPAAAKAASFSLRVPVLIEGSFDNPEIKPDTKRLLTDGLQIQGLDPNASIPEKIDAIKQGAKNLEKGFKGDIKQDLGGAVGGILEQLGGPKGFSLPGLTPNAPAAPIEAVPQE